MDDHNAHDFVPEAPDQHRSDAADDHGHGGHGEAKHPGCGLLLVGLIPLALILAVTLYIVLAAAGGATFWAGH